MAFLSPFVFGMITGGIAVWQWTRRTRQMVEEIERPIDIVVAKEATVPKPTAVDSVVSIAKENTARQTAVHSSTVLAVKGHPPADDFTRIVGLGPIYAKRLNAAGIENFAQIAALAPEQLAMIVIHADIDRLIDARSWIAQAQKLG